MAQTQLRGLESRLGRQPEVQADDPQQAQPYGGVSGGSATTFIQWGYQQTAAPVGPVGFTFGVDTDFDGAPDLTGDTTQIVNAAGVQQCTATADTTEPLDSPRFLRSISFPTACIRKLREIGDVSLTLTAGGVSKTILVDAVAFLPTA